MKTIEWQNCISRSAIGSYPPENGRMLNPDDDVVIGMKVSARYNDLTVILEIINEIKHQTFSAVVVSFEPVLGEKPSDLDQGDEVVIQKQNICCLFA